MDEKDALELSDPHDDVDGVAMLPTTSQMSLTVSDVGVPSTSAIGDDSQPCIVVVPVEEYESSHDGFSKCLDLGDPPDCSASSTSPGIMGINQDDSKTEESQPYDPVTQSWFTTKCSKDTLSEKGHKWKQGMWSRDEIDLLERNIEEYVKEHKLSDATEVIFNSSKDQRKNFYRKVAKGLQRPLFAVYRRVIRMYDQKNHVGKYSEEDIKKLKDLKARYGNDWTVIGAEMGRSASSVKDRFRLLKDSCNRGKWTVQEENILADAVFLLSGAQPGDSVTTGISWSQVADKVGTRTEKQCRAKWLNYLNWKQTGGSDWSRQDELTLITRISETEVENESDLDWVAIAKNWKSVRSPQWLRSKWWSLKRLVRGYDTMHIHSLLQHLKVMHCQRSLREERSTMPQVTMSQVNVSTVQEGSTESPLMPALMLPQSTLNCFRVPDLMPGQALTTVHEDNHIIIQIAKMPGDGGDSGDDDGSTRQIIITTTPACQQVPSLGVDETICGDVHIQQANADLSGDASTMVHTSDDLHGSSDHMTSVISQSQVNVVEEQPISSQAQLIGTDAVLPQQSVPHSDLVGGAETLVIVNTAPSTEELSQPTTGTVEDAHLGGGVFTLSGPLPVLQPQGDEHNLMGSPHHLDTLHHHHDDTEEDVEVEVIQPTRPEDDIAISDEGSRETVGLEQGQAQGLDFRESQEEQELVRIKEETDDVVDSLKPKRTRKRKRSRHR